MHTHLKTAKSDDLPGEVAFMGAKTSGKPDRAAPVAQPITIISPWILMIKMMLMLMQLNSSPHWIFNEIETFQWNCLQNIPNWLKFWCYWWENICKILVPIWVDWEKRSSWFLSWSVAPELLKFNSYAPFSQTFQQSCQDDRFLWPFNLLPGFTEKLQKFRFQRKTTKVQRPSVLMAHRFARPFKPVPSIWHDSIFNHFFFKVKLILIIVNGGTADRVWMFSDNLGDDQKASSCELLIAMH